MNHLMQIRIKLCYSSHNSSSVFNNFFSDPGPNNWITSQKQPAKPDFSSVFLFISGTNVQLFRQGLHSRTFILEITMQ